MPLSRLLVLAGAAGVAVSALLPWVTVEGIPLRLDLGLIGAGITPGGRTVSGTQTSVWPVLVAVAAGVAVLAAVKLARRLLVGVGLLVVAAGGGLLYYVQHVVQIEASAHGPVSKALLPALLTSSTGAGPPLLLASGIAIVLGALSH